MSSLFVCSYPIKNIPHIMTGSAFGTLGVVGFVEHPSLLVRPQVVAASLFGTSVASPKHSLVSSGTAPGGAEKQKGNLRFSSRQRCVSNGSPVQGCSAS